MIKRKNGYSLGVLVITIAVMLILTTTALISFKSMSSDKEITNFMNDLQEVEEYVKEYYATKHILPLEYSGGVPIGNSKKLGVKQIRMKPEAITMWILINWREFI